MGQPDSELEKQKGGDEGSCDHQHVHMLSIQQNHEK